MEIAQRLKYPSLLRRYLSSLIDGAVLFVVFAWYMREPLRSPLSQSPNYWPLLLLALYEPLLTRYSCTLGQLLMRIRIRTEPEIEPVPVWRTFLRLAVKYSLGILSFMFLPAHPQKRALHDLAANTIVLNARDVDSWREMARTNAAAAPNPPGPQNRFSNWLTGALLLPFPAVLGLSLFASLPGIARNSTVLLWLGMALLACGAVAFVATTIAVGSIARRRAQLSVRNVVQIAPAAVLASALVVYLVYGFFISHAFVHAHVG